MKQVLDAGKRPKGLYLLVLDGGKQVVSIKTGNPQINTLLTFTSGFAAVDYSRVAKLACGIHNFALQSLPTFVEQWKKMGIDSFVLDRCPRSAQFNAISIASGLTEQQFLAAWARYKANAWTGLRCTPIPFLCIRPTL